VASWDNGLYALRRSNGHLRWKSLASHRVGLRPVVAGPLVFLAPRTSESIQAFHLDDGAAAGAYQAGTRQEIPREPALRGTRLALLVSGPAGVDGEEEGNGRHRLRLLELSEASPSSPGEPGRAGGGEAAGGESSEDPEE
jgi:hypothetical protein